MPHPLAALILLLASSLASAVTQAQEALPDAVTMPAVEPSTIIVPVYASLAPLLPQLEGQVPKMIDQTRSYELSPDGRFAIKYRIERDPLVLTMQGAGLHATASIRYALEGCTRTRNPVTGTYYLGPCVSCGFGEPMRSATIELHSRLDWSSDWTMHPRTLARPVEFSNRCQVTFARIDVTDWKLAPIVNQQLAVAARVIDRDTPRLATVRPQAQQVWSALQAPIAISPQSWLTLDPIDVALAPVRGSGLVVATTLALHARARVVLGAKPPSSSRALPPLRIASVTDSGVRVSFDIEIPWNLAAELMTAQVGHRTLPLAGGSTMEVSDLRLAPLKDGRLRVEAMIDYRGGRLRSYRGLVQLEGHPMFDPGSNLVTVPDLDYAIASHLHNPFTRIAGWLVHEAVRSQLRANASWSIAEQLGRMKEEIARGLIRDLGQGVHLRGRVDSLHPASIVTRTDGIVIRVIATGSAEVDIR